MADRATIVRSSVTVLGLAVGVGGMIAAPLVPSLPWWTFFLAALVLPVTDPVATAAASRVRRESDVPDPADVTPASRS